jgi:hypothetical protein
MNRLTLGALAVGIICIALAMDEPARRRRPAIQPHINDWEGEGGAVPVDESRTAAQTDAAL